MNIGKIIGIAVLACLAGITVFHFVHHFLYCRYRGVPGKSHCAVCSHRRICQKYHHRH
jgi:hypothetical protein